MKKRSPITRERQFCRAVDLRRYLEGHCLTHNLPGRLADSAAYAIRDWLAREYRLGYEAGQRELKKR